MDIFLWEWSARAVKNGGSGLIMTCYDRSGLLILFAFFILFVCNFLFLCVEVVDDAMLHSFRWEK